MSKVGIKVGAGAFALGLTLMGPQAPGVAAADSDPGASADSAASATSAESTPPPRKRSASKAADRRAGTPAPSARGSDLAPPVAAARVVRGGDAVDAPERRSSILEGNRTRPGTAAFRTSIPAVAAVAAVAAVTAVAAVAAVEVTPDAVAAPQITVRPPAARRAGAIEAIGTTALPLSALPLSARPPAVANPMALLDTTVGGFLNGLTNWLNDLPADDVTVSLEGALLLLRRSLFNQSAVASPVQTTYHQASLTDDILGTIGARDPEGDPLTYTVVGTPANGTVVIAADGRYTYTPGAGFTGDDAFTVRIANSGSGFNLLNLTGDRATEVTVQVGAEGPAHPFLTATNIRESDLFLPNAPVSVTIQPKNVLTGQYSASVSLNVSDDTAVTWLDDEGNSGQISVAEVAAHWSGIQGAGDVMLGVDFDLGDDTTATVILTSVQATRTATGLYLFSGALAPDPVDGAGIDSYYDVVGETFKTGYENFLNGYVNVAGFTGTELYLTNADMYLDTFTVRDYQAALQGTDPGVTLTRPEGLQQGVLSASRAAVTAMLPYGDGFVMGLSSGAVKRWTGEGWETLKDTEWSSSITKMIPYGSGFVVGLADGAIEQWTGEDWTELRGTDWTSAVRTLMPYGSGFVVGLADGAVEHWTGDGWTELRGTDWQSGVQAMIPYGSGFVLGLADGAVEHWTGESWAELRGTDWQSGVTNMIPYGSGFVLGLADGAIERWDGHSWSELQGTGWHSGVMTMTPYGSGFVVGLADGAVEQWTGEGWRELQGTSWQSAVTTTRHYGSTGFVVGLSDGAVQQWTGAGWRELQGTGWDSAVTTMLPYGSGFVLGLYDGAVQQWTGDTWVELAQSRAALSADTLEAAIGFVHAGGTVLSEDDPLFWQSAFLPSCAAENNCDGTFYPVTAFSDPEKPWSLANTTFALGDLGQSLYLSYDVGATAYGYVFVPGGLWKKLNPSKYSAGFLTALTTGPSLSLALGTGQGTFNIANTNLANVDYYAVTPYGTVQASVGADASLDLQLDLPEGFTATKLDGSAYYTIGVLTTLNTFSDKGIQLGFNDYPTIDFSDFDAVTGVSLVPTITPYLNGKWGLFTASNTPIIGYQSLFSVNLGYNNPLSADLTLSRENPPSLTVSSSGNLTYGAGILDSLTSLLSFEESWEIYRTQSDNLLA